MVVVTVSCFGGESEVYFQAVTQILRWATVFKCDDLAPIAMARVFADPHCHMSLRNHCLVVVQVEARYECAALDLTRTCDVGHVTHQQVATVNSDVVALVAQALKVRATSDWSE